MRFLNITTGGFCNLEINSIELSSNVIGLIGPNSFGKSNLIKNIDFGVDFIKSSQKTKYNMMHWVKGIPINKKLQNQNFYFQFEAEVVINNDSYQIDYGFEFEWAKSNKSGATILSEWLKIKKDGKGQKFNQIINRTTNLATYKSSETGRCSTKISIDSDNLVVNKLLSYDNLYYLDIVKEINDLKVYINDDLEVRTCFEPDPILMRDVDITNLKYLENIPRIVSYIKESHPEKYYTLKESFLRMFSSIQDLDVIEHEIKSNSDFKIDKDAPFIVSNKVYSIVVLDDKLNQPIDFEQLSDGTKRIFHILTSAILADIQGYSLITIEEPENSIHPRLIYDFINTISNLAPKCKIILTSHSPFVVNAIELDNIYFGVNNDYATAKFEKVGYKKVNAFIRSAEELSLTTGEYLFDLITGDEKDINKLKTFVEV